MSRWEFKGRLSIYQADGWARELTGQGVTAVLIEVGEKHTSGAEQAAEKLQLRRCFERARIYPCRKCLNISRGFNP
jgi:hypothetical protein